jgi:hypothetical protein
MPNWNDEFLIPKAPFTDGAMFPIVTDGQTAVVGEWSYSGSSGRIHVFTRSGTNTWTFARTVENPGAAGDHFGYAVAVAGETIFASAPWFGAASAHYGRVYAFDAYGASAPEVIDCSDPKAEDYLGQSLSASGQRVAADAHSKTFMSASRDGAVYTWTRPGVGTAFSQEAKIPSPDPIWFECFGLVISLSGNVLAAMQVNKWFILRWSGSAWVSEYSLAKYAYSVSASGDMVLGVYINAAGDHGFRVVRYAGGVWTADPYVPVSAFAIYGTLDGARGIVAIAGDDEHPTLPNAGAIHIYLDNGTAFVDSALLLGGHQEANSSFGYHISLSGGYLAATDWMPGATALGSIFHGFFLTTSQELVGDRGGWPIQVGGTFPVGTPFDIYLGLAGDETDSPCYGGQGNGHRAVSEDGLTATAITPPCASGSRFVTVRIRGVNESVAMEVVEEPSEMVVDRISRLLQRWMTRGPR